MHALMSAAAELFPTLLVTIDDAGTIRSVSGADRGVLGETPDALEGQPFLDAVVAPAERERAGAQLRAALEDPERRVRPAFTAPMPGASPRYIAWRCVPAPDGGLLCAGEDVTEELGRQEQVRRAHHRLMVVSHLATMGEMTAGLAHELNQPLAAITNYARAGERFMAAAVPDPEEVRTILREISAEALRAADILRRLRRLVRMGDGERTRTRVNDLVPDVVALTQGECRAHDVAISTDLAPDLPEVMVDTAQVQHVLLNLLRNAVEALATRPGPRAVCIETRSLGDEVAISVRDNGPGVDRVVLDRIFNPFATTKPNGTGLGLAVSRSIIESHGGRLEYLPTRPGATFQIRLPAVTEKPA